MDEQFITELAACANDPLRYAHWAFPWGVPGTDLAKHDGPDFWQEELFAHIRDELAAGRNVIRAAIKSGHGIGKSAGFAMLADWGMSTFPGTRGVVTANTERQLRTKTWVELAKWRRLSLTRDLFKLKATSMFTRDPDHASEWRLDMAPWSERNTEAFAGLHNQGKRLLLFMDESSGIPDIIHEVAEGALTDENTQIIWIMLGNPTKNSGRFREAFDDGKFASDWKQITVDSRKSRFTNKEELNRRIELYGLDNDYTRVRILGLFPKADILSFFSRDKVLAALQRELPYTPNEPVVLGVDPARFGNDGSVIFPRQGLDARSRPVERYQGLDTVELAAKVSDAARRYNAAAIFVDGTGIGAGVVDILRRGHFNVFDVQFASKPSAKTLAPGMKLANKRAEIYLECRDWLERGCLQDYSVDTDHSMLDDFLATNFYYNMKDELILEPKSEIKAREGFSPDLVDALACTFAFPFIVSAGPQGDVPVETTVNYNPYRRAA